MSKSIYHLKKAVANLSVVISEAVEALKTEAAQIADAHVNDDSEQIEKSVANINALADSLKSALPTLADEPGETPAQAGEASGEGAETSPANGSVDEPIEE